MASEYDWVGPEELLVVVNDNYSLAFDGVNDVVNTQFLLNQEQNTSGYTFEAWVYPTSTSSGRHMVMSTDDGGFDWSILRQGNKWYVFTGSGSFDTGIFS